MLIYGFLANLQAYLVQSMALSPGATTVSQPHLHEEPFELTTRPAPCPPAWGTAAPTQIENSSKRTAQLVDLCWDCRQLAPAASTFAVNEKKQWKSMKQHEKLAKVVYTGTFVATWASWRCTRAVEPRQLPPGRFLIQLNHSTEERLPCISANDMAQDGLKQIELLWNMEGKQHLTW